MKSAIERFEERYIPEPNSGCWLWTGGIRPAGYGTFYDGTRSIGAHQFSWMIHNGADCVPPKMQVCHTCDNPPCVNPDHLWLGTRSENMLDASHKKRLADRTHFNSLKTHCPSGHPYEGANVAWNKKGRICVACQATHYRLRQERKAAIRSLTSGARA